MSRQWTRTHDAHIARACEGLEVELCYPDGYSSEIDGLWVPIAHYNTDLAAAMRALEAWRVADKPNRSYSIGQQDEQLGGHAVLVLRTESEGGSHWEPYSGFWSTLAELPAAIAWALWDATGGVE